MTDILIRGGNGGAFNERSPSVYEQGFEISSLADMRDVNVQWAETEGTSATARGTIAANFMSWAARQTK